MGTLNKLIRQILVNEERWHLCNLFFDPAHSCRKMQGLLNVGTVEKWIRLQEVLYGISFRDGADDDIHGKASALHHGLPREHVRVAFNPIEGAHKHIAEAM
jgi:hypothetical protein